MQANRVLFAAVSVVTLLSPCAALAQYATENNSGRLLDANNRLGSAGVNETRRSTGPSPDDIVYGNVTRGQQFRGRLNSTDATEFRGNISQPSDALVRDYGPSPYEQDNGGQYAAQRYYGDSRGVRAPALSLIHI